MKKEIIIFLIAYVIATLLRGFIGFYTGFYSNVFQDEFELIPFVIDITIWTLTYVGVRLIVTEFTK